MMFSNIQKKKWARIVAAYLVLNLLAEFVMPVAAFALTSGPAQEEFASFEPASTSDMVDLYSGDFNYNLPLLSVPGPNGGYPINLAYHSGIGMEQEASWVGLGWNINVGAINRNLRGLPDDFAGETVKTTNKLKKDWTIGLDLKPDTIFEQFGFPPPLTNPPVVPPLTSSWQVYYNNYRGMGVRATLSQMAKDKHNLSTGINLTYDSQNGIGIAPRLAVNTEHARILNGTYSASFSSRQGFQQASITKSHTGETRYGKEGTSFSTLTFGNRAGVPSVGIPMQTSTTNFSSSSGSVVGTGDYSGGNATLGLYYGPNVFSGSYNQSWAANGGVDNRSAYGFLYYGTGDNDENTLTDFQRSNLPYSKKVPALAPAQQTYDLYSVSGQGTGGMFRPTRNEAAVVSDSRKTSSNFTSKYNIELGRLPSAPANLHIGLGVEVGAGKITSGAWVSSGNFSDDQTNLGNYTDGFSGIIANNEPYVFQMLGEKSGILATDDFLTKWGGADAAVKVALTKSNDPNWTKRQFVATDKIGVSELQPATQSIGAGTKVKPIRAARATSIETFTVGEVLSMQIPNIGSRVSVRDGFSSSTQLNRSQLIQNRQSKHIAEISTLQSDGMRYTYGLPAYNESQKDVTFILDQTAGLSQTATSVPIPAAQLSGNSILTAGIYNEFYSETQLPAYTHSWLLTSVVSADYVDITGNGPSQDDYGYWVKFNYSKAQNLFSWRIPYHGVRYQEGYEGDPTDDKGFYTYGEKQLFYLDKIETKTHIAVFNLGDRKDSKEAVGDANANSGTGSDCMKRINSISLYTKAEYTTNAATAVPIKTVNFSYDYSLCPNVKNNDGTADLVNSTNLNVAKGKLTLKKVWFTYLNSTRGALSPYQFTYSTFNPAYNEGNLDRWGNYKDNTAAYSNSRYPYFKFSSTDQLNYSGSTTAPTALDQPYSPSSAFANRSEELASAWALTSVRMPSGGTMDIHYELDDYSHNEDIPAMQLFDITDDPARLTTDSRDLQLVTQTTETLNMSAYTNYYCGAFNNWNYRVYFKLDKPVTLPGYVGTSLGSAYILEKYLRGTPQVFFKTTTQLKGGSSTDWDQVAGWAELEAGTNGPDYVGLANSSIGYVTLKKENLNEINILNNSVGTDVPPYIHPFRKAAFQHLRSNRSELLYNAVPYANNWLDQLGNFISSVAPMASELLTAAAGGFNNAALVKNFASEIRLNGHSVIRLCDGDGRKYGGGVRVKKLTLNDHWVSTVTNSTPTETADEYGQVYSYQMPDGTSSGVAYEPQIGREESALVQPIEYPLSTKIKNPDNLYLETPILENYYPSASVGYRRVIVKSVAPKEALEDNPANQLLRAAAPIAEYLFYTPKEFPVYTDETDMNTDIAIYRPILIPGFYNGMIKRKARTQGYLVELNDMAGKPRMMATYTRDQSKPDEMGKLISKVEYFYETRTAFNPEGANRLSSKVRVIKPGTNSSDPMLFDTGIIGQTEDVFVDMDEDLQQNSTIGLEVNFDMYTSSPPLFALVPIPTASTFEASMRTIVTHKIVHRSGLLKETVVTTDESVISTKNLAYDLETAQPILTQVTNDYKDDVYNLAYPAHWYYPGMQGAYRNYRAQLSMPANTTIAVGSGGRVTLTGLVPSGKTAHDYFEPGDEVYIDFATGVPDGIYWVYKVGPNGSGVNYIDLITASGALVPVASTINSIKVMRSGHRNLVSASAGGVAFKTITGFTPWTTSTTTNSGTFNFDQVLNASAVQYSDIWSGDCYNCNSELNVMGDVVNPYRAGMLGNWRAFKSYAYRTQRNQNDNIRDDGTLTDFNTFNWRSPSSSHPNWITASTVTMYSPYGFELENRDPLGNYSAATYEYNSSLATMVGSNARYRELGSDGFEDYAMVPVCTTNYDHWGFGPYISKLKTTQQHTGRFSLELLNGESAAVTHPVFTGTEYDALVEPLRMNQLTWNDNASVAFLLNATKDCSGTLRLTPGKTYVASSWLKQTGGPLPVNTSSNYTLGQLVIEFYNGPSLVSSQVITGTDNTIIEGWQRLNGTFQVPASGVTNVSIVLRNTASQVSTPCYFDDVRVHPYDGQAKTFVYDQTTLKLMAELDENNYATFYNYDDEGHLVKVRKETREGIKTLKEGRINTRTNY